MNSAIEALCQDRHHGASALLEQFLNILPGLGPEEVLTSLEHLRQAFPVMAVWAFCHNYFSQHGSGSSRRQVLIEDISQARGIAVSASTKEISEYHTLLTISNSSLVRATITSLTEIEPRRVILSRSFPAREGEQLAADLAGFGVEIELVEDWELVDRIVDAEAIVLGADWATDHGFVNKQGSAELVRAAVPAQRPVYVLAETFKHAGEPNFASHDYYQTESSDSIRQSMKVFEWVSHEDGSWIYPDNRTGPKNA
jgi:translation initiation factor 2B subunit (eIF-2B alpha/beta/delta family)